ncbi:MAG TPA: apolipoprotein N-acyltransferase [Polyangiaceae bacterium]|nr:apolipoprotein N-acyltransferase [Polyangiaceae bacterium]
MSGRARGALARHAAGVLASAALCALYARAEAPFHALGFVALVPWLLALGRAASLGSALGSGLAMSAAFSLSVFAWLPGAVERYARSDSALPWLALVAAAPLLEPQFVAFALARRVLARAPGAPGPRAALAAAAAYVGAELVSDKLLVDTLGQGLYPSPYLRQAADLAGVHGLSLLLVLANEALAAAAGRAAGAFRARGGGPASSYRAALAPLGAAAAIAAALYAYGLVRYRQIAGRGAGAAPSLVGVVQANVTNYDKLRAEKGAFEAVRAILDDHYALTDGLREGREPDLVVWPETMYPTTFGAPKSEAGAAFDAELVAFAASRGLPLVFGSYDREGGREYNAAFFLGAAAAGGRPAVAAYRKGNLFPFTERVPAALDSAWLRGALPWVGDWHAGPGPEVVRLALRGGRTLSVAPLICYDALFPGFVAEAARAGAELIVTLSNDSWFPDDRAPRLHFASAAFRSIETRLPQVRATNSGVSALIAPTGDVIAGAGWGERRAFAGALPSGGGGPTLAVLLAPWLGPALVAFASLVVLAELWRRRAAPASASAAPAEAGRPERAAASRRSASPEPGEGAPASEPALAAAPAPSPAARPPATKAAKGKAARRQKRR